MCVLKEEEVQTLEKEPVLECTHKNVEKCHYTYVTEFEANQEELCNENFEKKCQITFKKEAVSEKVKKCYRPQESACGNNYSLSQSLPCIDLWSPDLEHNKFAKGTGRVRRVTCSRVKQFAFFTQPHLCHSFLN